jgi:hypothetical protein
MYTLETTRSGREVAEVGALIGSGAQALNRNTAKKNRQIDRVNFI